MKPSSEEMYLRTALRLALAARGERWELHFEDARPHLERLGELREELGRTVAGETMLRFADARVSAAVAEIVDGAAPPTVKRLDLHGYAAVEVDLIGEKLVAERKRQLSQSALPSWRKDLGPQVEKWAGEAEAYLNQRRAAAPVAPPPEPPPLPPAAELTVKYDGARLLQVGEKILTLPLPIWRGVHEADRLYEANDLVTMKGGMWIALVPTQETPGNSAYWKLCVKPGRDARDRDRNA